MKALSTMWLVFFAFLQQAAVASVTSDQRDQALGYPKPKYQSLMGNESNDQTAEMPVPESVTVQRDIAYGEHSKQRFDVYFSKSSRHAPTAPVIFMVHGGAWQIGDKDGVNVVGHKVVRWVPQGVVFISTNYRLLPDADPLTQAKDVARALAKAQSLAASWGADRSRFVLMGHSAGAHLVTLLNADPTIAFEEGASPWLGAIALDSAAYNVPQIMQTPRLRLYDQAFGKDAGYWASVSPYHRLTPKTRPLLMVCSAPQPLYICWPQVKEFAVKSYYLGGKTEIIQLNMTHEEINANLGLKALYTKRVELFLNELGFNIKPHEISSPKN